MSLKHFFDKLTTKPSAQEPSAFLAVPSFKSDEHAILATLFEGHFYWLGTYHPGDSVKIWLSRARESLRHFPEIVDTFC